MTTHPTWCQRAHPGPLHVSPGRGIADQPVATTLTLEQSGAAPAQVVTYHMTSFGEVFFGLGLAEAAAMQNALGELLALAAGQRVARALAALAAFGPLRRDEAARLLDMWSGRIDLTGADIDTILGEFPPPRGERTVPVDELAEVRREVLSLADIGTAELDAGDDPRLVAEGLIAALRQVAQP